MHQRGAFSVARFDLPGNARAFRMWDERQVASRFVVYVWSQLSISAKTASRTKTIEMENALFGYLELNGTIHKIRSEEDLHDFVRNLGQGFREYTKEDYEQMCKRPDDDSLSPRDDCGATYSEDGRKLTRQYGRLSEYKVKEGTLAVCNKAVSPNGGRGITNIFLPDTVLAIGQYAFAYRVQYVGFSRNLRYIAPKAFSACRRLANVVLPSSLAYIGKEAFAGCEGLTEIVLPASLKEIGSSTFMGCCHLQSATFQSSNVSIGSNMFDGCTQLQEIRIPKGTLEKFQKQLPANAHLLKEMD